MSKSRIKKLRNTNEGGSFCMLWITSRSALQLISAVTRNPFIKIACASIITFGNKLHKKLCD